MNSATIKLNLVESQISCIFAFMKTKVCNTCKVEKDINQFNRRTSKATGEWLVGPWCKECISKKNKEYRSRLEVKEKSSSMMKKYRIENRERRLLEGCRNRAIRKNIPFNLTIEDIIIPEKCPILGTKLLRDDMSNKNLYGPSVDRIIPELGYVKGNIMIMSRKANMMKTSATPQEIAAFCNYFINNREIE